MSLTKYTVLLLLVLILSFTLAPPTYASVCRNYNGQQICILSINRSAKNYWEYKASVSVNGVKRPIEVYNCRERAKVQKDPGKLICSFFNSPVR